MAPSKSSRQKVCFAKRKPNNAPRIPSHIWKAKQPFILKLYQEEQWKLEDVIQHMAQFHGFTPTKRQYVHQLQKWGVTKYRKRPDDVGAVHQPDPRESPTPEPTHCKGNNPTLNAVQQSSHGRSLSPFHGESASEDDVDAPTYIDGVDNDFVSGGGDGRWLKLKTTDGDLDNLFFPTDSLSPGQLRRAAYALFAASDDEMALPLLHKLHHIWPNDSTVATMIARSTHAPRFTTAAKAVLASTVLPSISNVPTDGSHSHSLLFRLLEIYIDSHEGSKDAAIRRARQLSQDLQTQQEQLQEVAASFSRPGVLVDLTVYQVLAYVQRLANGPSPKDSTAGQQSHHQLTNPGCSLGELFDRFHTSSIQRLKYVHRPCLRDCLAWCNEQLDTPEDVPHLLTGISSSPVSSVSPQAFPACSPAARPDESDGDPWAQQYEIFAFLWCRWQQLGGSAGDDGGAWSNTAETQIGITAAELLAIACWLIVDLDIEEEYSPSPSPSRSPAPGPSNYRHHAAPSSYPSSPLLQTSSTSATPSVTLSPGTPFYTSIPENDQDHSDCHSASTPGQESDDDGSWYEEDTHAHFDPDMPTNLADLARTGIEYVLSLDDARLWDCFLDQIAYMNSIVQLDATDEAFKGRALRAFRKLVFDTVTEGG